MRITTALIALGVGVTSARAQTTIEWWQFWTDPSIKPTIEAMVQDFERENPDIRVKLTDLTWANGHEKIAIAVASGTAPDVLELGSDWIAQFAAEGQLADISDDIALDSAGFNGWSLATYRGRVYARPWILGTRVLFINQDLLKRAGLDENTVPVTWGELMAAAQAISKLGRGVYGWGSNIAEKHRLYKKFLPFVWSNGGQILSDDGEFCVISSTRAVGALKFYKSLQDCCSFVDDQRGLEDAFLDNKIGFIISGDWLLKRIQQEKRSIRFATTVLPGNNPNLGEERTPGVRSIAEVYPGKSFLGGEFLAVTTSSTHRAEALKLIAYITRPENQVRFCKANYSANPSSRNAQQDAFFQENPHLQTFGRQMRLSSHPPVDPDWVFMEDEIEKAVEDVVFNDAAPGEALRRAQIRITELRTKAK